MASGNHSRAFRLRRGRRRSGAGALEMPDQAIDQIGLLVGGHAARPFGIAAIDRDGDKLVAAAPLEKAAVRVPVVAHINRQVPRHAVEQAVLRVETLADHLSEDEGGKQRLKLVKFMVAQTSHRFVQGQVVNIERAGTASRPTPPPQCRSQAISRTAGPDLQGRHRRSASPSLLPMPLRPHAGASA